MRGVRMDYILDPQGVIQSANEHVGFIRLWVTRLDIHTCWEPAVFLRKDKHFPMKHKSYRRA